jgi:ABC-type nitrate/sulfonate/bicarbonate transport system substrate-binding protein
LVRATLRGIHLAKSNRQEAVRSIMKWAEMDQALAEGSYEMAASGWSTTGAASSQGVQIAMEEIRAEFKLETTPEPSKAFDWRFVQNSRIGGSDELLSSRIRVVSFFAAAL